MRATGRLASRVYETVIVGGERERALVHVPALGAGAIVQAVPAQQRRVSFQAAARTQVEYGHGSAVRTLRDGVLFHFSHPRIPAIFSA